MTRLESNEIFSPSNKIHREVGRAKDLSAIVYQSGSLRNTLHSRLAGVTVCGEGMVG